MAYNETPSKKGKAMNDNLHSVKYHTAQIVDVQKRMSELVEKINSDGFTDTERILLNDLEIQLHVHADFLDEAVKNFPAKKVPFWKKPFQK